MDPPSVKIERPVSAISVKLPRPSLLYNVVLSLVKLPSGPVISRSRSPSLSISAIAQAPCLESYKLVVVSSSRFIFCAMLTEDKAVSRSCK